MTHPYIEKVLHTKTITETGCWTVRKVPNANGYVYFMIAGKQSRAHRTIYQELVGPIPRGLTLDHLCHNRKCFNPSHLEPVTQRENIQRGAAYRLTHGIKRKKRVSKQDKPAKKLEVSPNVILNNDLLILLSRKLHNEYQNRTLA